MTVPSRLEFPITLPRHAFSLRNAARAGDVWRGCQEVALEGSTLVGWPPHRYRASGSAFVVRKMRTFHQLEASYGEALRAATWVHAFKRDMLVTREIRLASERGLVASATQEWVHVSAAAMKAARAGAELLAAFRPHESEDLGPTAPAFEPLPGATRHFRFRTWWTWMDPLDHVNHPAYVDFCDEAISREMSAHGLKPLLLRPVYEELSFHRGVEADVEVEVQTTRAGVTSEGAVVLKHEILVNGARCSRGITVRTLHEGDPAALVRAFD